jgi:hypothetical protein
MADRVQRFKLVPLSQHLLTGLLNEPQYARRPGTFKLTRVGILCGPMVEIDVLLLHECMEPADDVQKYTLCYR